MNATPFRVRKAADQADPVIRVAARMTGSVTALDRLPEFANDRLRRRGSQPRKSVDCSLLGKALTYLRGQWPKLIRYTENGNWPISNNACENSIRPFCVRRRSWLFADTVAGADASANIYSIVETCRAHRIDTYRYLTWLFKRLPLVNTVDEYDALLPWKMPADIP